MKVNELNDALEFYFNKQLLIHIDTIDGSYYNGLILELSKTLLVIDDRILGEVAVPVSDIKILERFKERENNGNS